MNPSHSLSGAADGLPRAPSVQAMWNRLLIAASVVIGLFMIDRLTALLLNFWLLESMEFTDVFWINLQMRAALFGAGFALTFAALAAPAFVHGLPAHSRKLAMWVGALGGLLMGYELNGEYLEFLGPIGLIPFGETDPIFNNDISFYVFGLPPIRTALSMALLISLGALFASITTAYAAGRSIPRPEKLGGLPAWLGRIGTPFTLGALLTTGLLSATLIWLRRYTVLTMENFEDATEGTGAGAEYVDVEGFFSTLNSIYVEALAVLALTIGLTIMLRTARKALLHPGSVNIARAFRPAAFALVLLPGISTDLAFRSAVAIRDELAVIPNEPVIQLPYLQRHIDATLKAFGLTDVDETTYVPPRRGDPLPELESMVNHPSVRNAPLWGGAILRYSRLVAPQYVDRILLADGDMTVYAPTLQILEAQQTLRPYYGFLDVDALMADVDGEPTMFSTAVRELPQDIVRPWLIAWGQRALLLTHGHGLVSVLASERTPAGDPVYGSAGVPISASYPALNVDNPSVYYGEGAVNAAFSNASGIREHDIATDQGRIEVEFPQDVRAGIRVDSLLKRLVVAYQTRQFIDVLFSDLITDESRVHVFRRPIERIEQIAPFLKLDTDPFAVPAQGRVMWMVNGLTLTNEYPYSARTFFGDGADLRTEWRPLEEVNYMADSVKATVEADTGQVTLYQFSDEPIVATWAQVYPSLFKPVTEMPADVRAQVQYPPELMSIQFNKIYPFYHQRDALTFYTGEDLLDDADEVVGPILGAGGAAITFSQGLYHWVAKPGDILPASTEPMQFALSKNYTPQDPLNLRAIATVYQTGDDYGKLSVLKIPKGQFHLGPEQADAATDQDAYIAQQIGLWSRLGVEVIRGRTSLMIVEGEVLYVEPIFIRSRQNPVPQLQRVIIVFRDKPYMGTSMEEALTYALEGGQIPGLNEKFALSRQTVENEVLIATGDAAQ